MLNQEPNTRARGAKVLFTNSPKILVGIVSKITKLLLCFGVNMFVLCKQVEADVSLAFSVDNGTSFADTFQVSSGDKLIIAVFALDQNAGGVLQTDGLKAFSLWGTMTPNSFALDSSGLICDLSINPKFVNPIGNWTEGTTVYWEAYTGENDQYPVGSQILLGKFEFCATMIGSAMIEFRHLSHAARWYSGAGELLDEKTFGNDLSDTYGLTINSIAVPEPGVCGLLLVILIGAGIPRRRLTIN